MPATAAGGPFAGLPGNWVGQGMLTYANGTQERISCRVQYVQSSPNNLQQAIRCASDSYSFQIDSYFDSANGRLDGTWAERFRNIGGSLSGTVSGGRINGSLSGPNFVAQLSVVTRGERQQVNIQAAVVEVRAISIELRKASQ
jgi:hypothetical protein